MQGRWQQALYRFLQANTHNGCCQRTETTRSRRLGRSISDYHTMLNTCVRIRSRCAIRSRLTAYVFRYSYQRRYVVSCKCVIDVLEKPHEGVVEKREGSRNNSVNGKMAFDSEDVKGLSVRGIFQNKKHIAFPTNFFSELTLRTRKGRRFSGPRTITSII